MIFFILIAAIVTVIVAVILFKKYKELPKKNTRQFDSFIPIEDRKQIYIDLLKRMKNCDESGFCLQISFLRKTSKHAVFISDLPELMQYCPERIFKDCFYVGQDYWFDRENTLIRINILRKILKDLK